MPNCSEFDKSGVNNLCLVLIRLLGRTQAKSNGYQSEPEPCYDSDYSVIKYRPVNTQRLQSVSSALNVRSSNDKWVDRTATDVIAKCFPSYPFRLYGTLPNPVKSEQNTYKNQPGRIEDYVTGHSSISEKETKKVSDPIFLTRDPYHFHPLPNSLPHALM